MGRWWSSLPQTVARLFSRFGRANRAAGSAAPVAVGFLLPPEAGAGQAGVAAGKPRIAKNADKQGKNKKGHRIWSLLLIA
jgi:hypothetical protein